MLVTRWPRVARKLSKYSLRWDLGAWFLSRDGTPGAGTQLVAAKAAHPVETSLCSQTIKATGYVGIPRIHSDKRPSTEYKLRDGRA